MFVLYQFLALSRLMLFQKYASKTQHSIRVHTTVLMRFGIKPSKTIELRVHATKGIYKHMHLRYFGHRFQFDAFSTVHTNTI